MLSMESSNSFEMSVQPSFSNFGNVSVKKEDCPVKVEYINDMYSCTQVGHGSPGDFFGFTDIDLNSQSQYTPLLTPEQLKQKLERETNQLVPNLPDFELTSHYTGRSDDWQDQSPYNWTPDLVYAWLHQCMYELEQDYSDIGLEDFYLSGQQLCQMTRDDFIRKAPKSGSILYNKLQSRLHIGACIKPSVFNEDPCDGDFPPSDLLLDIQDDKDLSELLSSDILDFLEKNGQLSDSDPPSPTSYCGPPSPTSSQYTTDSEVISSPPSPKDAAAIFAEINAGFPRYRTNSAGEDTDDSDMFSDTKSESSSDHLPPVNIKIPIAPKTRGGKNLQMLQNLKAKRPRGRPRKPVIKTESSSDEDDDDIFIHPPKGKGMKGNHLWEFIRDLLKSPHYNPDYIRWEDSSSGVFRIVHSEAVAKAWGKKKNNPRMTYEKLSRAMRYYYKRDILERVDGRRLVYKFGKKAYGWQESAKLSAN